MAPFPWALPGDDPIDITEDSDDEVDVLIVDPDTDQADDEGFVGAVDDRDLRDVRERSASSQDLTGYRRLNDAMVPGGFTVQLGDTVELDDGDFLRILHILQRTLNTEILLKGVLFRRAGKFGAYFPKQQNELIAMLQKGSDIANPSLDSALVIRSASSALMLRDLTLTNAMFPTYSFRQDGKFYSSVQDKRDLARLTCRWKSVAYVNHKNGHILSGAMIMLAESEADPGKSISDVMKKRRWLEQETTTIKGEPALEPRSGHILPSVPQARNASLSNSYDLTSDDDDDIQVSTPKRKRESGLAVRTNSIKSYSGVRQLDASTTRASPQSIIDLSGEEDPYTFGDICAGAGGMSAGATHTGDITVAFQVDVWDKACNTLRRNFSNSKVIQRDIFDFCQKLKFESWMRVNILHISFPCQYWSGVHTRPGKDDQKNADAMISIEPLFKRCRPRVVTFEQAPGLIQLGKHRQHWQNLIHQITARGYSVRWAIRKCSEYGNVQRRARLFLFASCPGEPLPPFPKPTHGDEPGLKPFVTVQDCLDLLPPRREIEKHMWQCTRKDQRPYDPNKPLPQCVTKNGGLSDLHPSGKRSFTIQELALLQGFYPEHKFADDKKTALREQIGNAVPGMVGTAMFKSIIKSMRETDERDRKYKPEEVSLLEEDD